VRGVDQITLRQRAAGSADEEVKSDVCIAAQERPGTRLHEDYKTNKKKSKYRVVVLMMPELST